MSKPVVFSIIALVAIGIGVSRVKYEVVFLRKALKSIVEENEKHMDDIKVLGAEWSFLNSPERLKKLAAKYLPNMKPIENGQIMSYKKIIEMELESSSNEDASLSLDGIINKALDVKGSKN